MLRAHDSDEALRSLLALLAAFEDLGLQYVLVGRRSRTQANLAGHGDLDVLVGRADGAAAKRALLGQGFRERPPHPWFRGNAVADYVGLDEVTGRPTHIQLHHELRLGRSVTRSFRLPVIEYLTRASVFAPPLRLPEPSAHLLLHLMKSLLGMSVGDAKLPHGPFDGEELRLLLPLAPRQEILTSGRRMLPMLGEEALGAVYEVAEGFASAGPDRGARARIIGLSRELRRGLADWSQSPRSIVWMRSLYRRGLRRVGMEPQVASRRDSAGLPVRG